MALNLKPLGSRVVIDPIEQEDITPGGIAQDDLVGSIGSDE